MRSKFWRISFTIVSIALVIIILYTLNDIFAQNEGQKEKDKNNQFETIEGTEMSNKIVKSDEEWKKVLSAEEYRVLRKKGTERPFSGEYNDFKRKGVFRCAGCGNILFTSNEKYNSGSGWPSFWAPASQNNIQYKKDNSLFMERTEILCSRCGGHLGHVFDDGPAPTHQRYCINSIALDFETKEVDSTKIEINNNK